MITISVVPVSGNFRIFKNYLAITGAFDADQTTLKVTSLQLQTGWGVSGVAVLEGTVTVGKWHRVTIEIQGIAQLHRSLHGSEFLKAILGSWEHQNVAKASKVHFK